MSVIIFCSASKTFFFCRNDVQAIDFLRKGSYAPGRSRREPPTMGKQLVNFITCGCESSAAFFVIYKAGREPTPYW